MQAVPRLRDHPAKYGKTIERSAGWGHPAYKNDDRCDREGQPLERVVALPVKDPYHIARNLIQVLELFSSCDPLSPP